jgi:hypothetical protein
LLLVLGVHDADYGCSCRVREWIQDGNSCLYLREKIICRVTLEAIVEEGNPCSELKNVMDLTFAPPYVED